MGDQGIISFITGVAGAGSRLSLILNASLCEFPDDDFEIRNISQGVTMFSLMAKQVGGILQDADSVHSHEAVDIANRISEESTKVFDEIERMLWTSRTRRADDSSTPSIKQRFKWCFKKGRVQYLLAQLESLKLNLSLMLQILSLGKLMASTSKNDLPEEVQQKTSAIQQERVETANVIIVRYWQMDKTEQLYEMADHEDEEEKRYELEDKSAELAEHDAENGNPTLSIEAAPEEYQQGHLTRLSPVSLGEIDQTLNRIRQSPREMLRASEEVIDPLLERWTNWHEIRERRHKNRNSGGPGKFAPSAKPLYEDDEDKPAHERFRPREDSPRGFYLEGTTTDWRKPHSSAAMQERTQLRRNFSGYQPSVSANSANSSENEDSPSSRGSRKRAPTRYVIDSDTESSSEEEPKPRAQHRRQSSGSPTTEKRPNFTDSAPFSHSYNGPATFGGQRYQTSPGSTTPQPGPSAFSQKYTPANVRPGQMLDQRTLSPQGIPGPLPLINTSGAMAPYPPTSPAYPTRDLAPLGRDQLPPGRDFAPPGRDLAPPGYGPIPRYMNPSSRPPMSMRPGSSDGKPKSPSRLGSYSGTSSSSKGAPRTEEDRRADKKRRNNNLKKGATKGLLGAGAMAGFLEMLEGLDF